MNRTALKPGFKITEEQFQLFWSLWRQACAWQRWDKLPSKERDEKRYEVLESVGFISLKDVNCTDGFDDMKAELLLWPGASAQIGTMQASAAACFITLTDSSRSLTALDTALRPSKPY